MWAPAPVQAVRRGTPRYGVTLAPLRQGGARPSSGRQPGHRSRALPGWRGAGQAVHGSPAPARSVSRPGTVAMVNRPGVSPASSSSASAAAWPPGRRTAADRVGRRGGLRVGVAHGVGVNQAAALVLALLVVSSPAPRDQQVGHVAGNCLAASKSPSGPADCTCRPLPPVVFRYAVRPSSPSSTSRSSRATRARDRRHWRRRRWVDVEDHLIGPVDGVQPAEEDMQLDAGLVPGRPGWRLCPDDVPYGATLLAHLRAGDPVREVVRRVLLQDRWAAMPSGYRSMGPGGRAAAAASGRPPGRSTPLGRPCDLVLGNSTLPCWTARR